MLNLEAKTKPQELILTYLEKNASETLKEKINSGIQIEKDSVQLISKKTLDGFMKYAAEEAKKLADKGATSACVEDETVYGWTIHYFEEDSIEGTLYNLDGTEYKLAHAPVKKAAIPNCTPSAPKKQLNEQTSMFDVKKEIQDESVSEKPNQEEEQPKAETEEIAVAESTENPIFVRYMALSEKYPNCVVALRLGDFYEILGKNAVTIATELDITLTGRDLGLPRRVPMVGFPYHASDMYFKKIHEKHSLVVVDDDGEQVYSLGVDTTTGEIIEDIEDEPDLSAFDRDILIKLDILFGNKITLG